MLNAIIVLGLAASKKGQLSGADPSLVKRVAHCTSVENHTRLKFCFETTLNYIKEIVSTRWNHSMMMDLGFGRKT